MDVDNEAIWNMLKERARNDRSFAYYYIICVL